MMTTPTLNGFLRTRQAEGVWVFEVGVVVWVGHEPGVRWVAFRRWKTAPDAGRLSRARAAALAEPRYFRRCAFCDAVHNAGHMHSRDVCQGCAERTLGVVH